MFFFVKTCRMQFQLVVPNKLCKFVTQKTCTLFHLKNAQFCFLLYPLGKWSDLHKNFGKHS